MAAIFFTISSNDSPLVSERFQRQSSLPCHCIYVLQFQMTNAYVLTAQKQMNHNLIIQINAAYLISIAGQYLKPTQYHVVKEIEVRCNDEMIEPLVFNYRKTTPNYQSNTPYNHPTNINLNNEYPVDLLPRSISIGGQTTYL